MMESIFMSMQYVDTNGLLEIMKLYPWMLHTQSGLPSQESRLQELCGEITQRLSDSKPLPMEKRIKPAYMDLALQEGCCDMETFCQNHGLKPEEVMETGAFSYADEYTDGFDVSYACCKDHCGDWHDRNSNEAFSQGAEDAKELRSLLGL